MTEMEKARAGLEFIRGDARLRAIRERAESLCFRLNHTPPEEGEKRQALLRELIPNQGENCFIKPPFLCDYGEFIILGNNFFANYGCKLVDGGTIRFGDDVLVGPGCTFVTVNHAIEPERRLAGVMQCKPITVGNNVWFGAEVTVCPGVTIGDNCVIGAGSVVTKVIPANTVAAGNPCKVIRVLEKNFKKDEKRC